MGEALDGLDVLLPAVVTAFVDIVGLKVYGILTAYAERAMEIGGILG